MKKHLVQLNVAILDPDAVCAQKVRDLVDRIGKATTVDWYERPESALHAFVNHTANALFIDLWSVGVERAIKFIEDTRGRFPHIPICLVGTREQFDKFPDVSGDWRRRFGHYYWLTRDWPQVHAKREAVAALERMEFYLVSKAAKDQLHHAREHVLKYGKSSDDEAQRQAVEAIDLAEQAIDIKALDLGVNHTIVPGFETDDIQELIKDTLDRSSSALRQTAGVNVGVLIVGGLLVVGSFAVASINQSWEAVTFGGFGIAGIIASLITNSLRSIGDGARHLVQV